MVTSVQQQFKRKGIILLVSPTKVFLLHLLHFSYMERIILQELICLLLGVIIGHAYVLCVLKPQQEEFPSVCTTEIYIRQ